MAEGDGACTDEVLDNVRELLRGQRRLEQLVAVLARGLEAGGASSGAGSVANEFPRTVSPLALAQAAGEDFCLPEGDLARADAEEKPVGGLEAVDASGDDSVALAQAAGEGFCLPEGDLALADAEKKPSRNVSRTSDLLVAMNRSGSSDEFLTQSASIQVVTQLWLERVEIREKLADCGNSEGLAKECQRQSALVRSRTHMHSDSDLLGTSPHSRRLRRQKSLGRGHALRGVWLSWLSKNMMLCPASGARTLFDLISICVLAYNLLSIPYFIAFKVDIGDNPWYIFECMAVVFWSLDLLVSFRTGYYLDGHLYMSPGKVARRYLRGSFFLDIVTLTVDIMSIILYTSADSAKFVRMLKIVRVMRLSAVMRMRRVNAILERLGYTSHVARLKTSGSLFGICKFLLVLLWINHAIACLWCFLGREDSQDIAPDTDHTWMDLQTSGLAGTYGNYGHAYQYTTAFHWALGQMTPGSMQVFPVNSIERVFNIFVLMGGFLVFSFVVSAISTNAAQLRIDMKGNTQKMEGLTRFLLASQIRPALRMQVCKQANVKLMYVHPQALKDLAVLDMISLSLRHALQLALCNPHFLEHPLLHFISNHDCAMWEETCMTCAHFSLLVKGDNLFVFGKEAEGMYFVVRGALSYDLNDSFNRDSQELSKEVEPGAWLSEAALWCHWRHMGCAEAQGEACCEVLLLKADALMPILTRKGLTGQMAWAYAHSLHSFLQNSKPPLCNWPNDLILPFGSDEVIAAMTKNAAVIMGLGAIEVLKARPGTFASWLGAVREDKIEKLASEVADGGSTLLVTNKQGVVRCVPLVVLRLRRQDGRMFVRMRLASKADGSREATCKLPGGKQRAGENPDMCLQRLLEGKLSALADSIELVGVQRQRTSENSRTFGVPTRYVRTVVSAAWPEHADADLGQFSVVGVGPKMTTNSKFSNRSHRLSPKEDVQPSWPVEVFALPGDGDFYAWLTEGQLAFLSSSQGQPNLYHWLSELYKVVERPEASWQLGTLSGAYGSDL